MADSFDFLLADLLADLLDFLDLLDLRDLLDLADFSDLRDSERIEADYWTISSADPPVFDGLAL